MQIPPEVKQKESRLLWLSSSEYLPTKQFLVNASKKISRENEEIERGKKHFSFPQVKVLKRKTVFLLNHATRVDV